MVDCLHHLAVMGVIMNRYDIRDMKLLEVKQTIEQMRKSKIDNIFHAEIFQQKQLPVLSAEVAMLDYVLAVLEDKLNDVRTTTKGL
jgi:hypothetical protein